MKKFIMLFTFFSLSFNAHAQFFEKSFQNNLLEGSYAVIPDNSNGWIIAGNKFSKNNFWVALRQEIYHLDNNGNILSSSNNTDVGKTILSLIPVNNGFIAVGSLSRYQQGNLKMNGGFLTKFDYSGNLIWNYQNPNGQTSFVDSTMISAIELNNGDILGLSMHGELIKLDSIGNFLSKNLITNDSTQRFFSIVQHPNNEIIAASQNKVFHLDSNQNLLSTLLFSSFVNDFILFQNEYYSIENQSINKFDTQFVMINSIDLSNDFSAIHKVKFHGNKAIVAGKNPNGKSILNYYNLAFQLENTTYLDNDGLKVNDIEINNNIVAIVGNESTEIHQPQSRLSDTASVCSFIKTYDMNLQTVEVDVDIELSELQYDNITFYDSPCSPNVIGEKGMIIHNVQLKIRNNGNVLIDSVNVLNRKLGLCSSGHSEFSYHQRFKNLALNPNDTTLIIVGDINIHHVNLDQVDETFCFWLSSPNGKIDNDIWNNKICETHSITSTNGFSQEKIFNLYPNPAIDILNIDFNDNIQIKTIKVINQIGQTVDNQIIDNYISNYQLNISQLSKGIYILKIETNEGQIMKRFIKQ